MKYIILITVVILMIISACRLTNPGGTTVNEAMLVVENYTQDTYYVTIEDGSLGPYEEYILSPDGTITKTWEADAAVFVINNGQVLIRYHVENGPEEISYQQLAVGYTNYFTFSSSQTYLEIRNDTSSDAWYNIDSSEPGFLFAGETDLISFGEIGFSQEVELFYTGYHVFSNNLQLTLYPSETYEIEIEADAGAVKLENNSLSDIVEVYIAPQADAYWGNNVLDYILEPEEASWWTVEPGWWDIRVVDEWDISYDFLNNYIALDETEIFTFRSSTKRNDQSTSEGKLIDPTSSRSLKLEIKNRND